MHTAAVVVIIALPACAATHKAVFQFSPPNPTAYTDRDTHKSRIATSWGVSRNVDYSSTVSGRIQRTKQGYVETCKCLSINVLTNGAPNPDATSLRGLTVTLFSDNTGRPVSVSGLDPIITGLNKKTTKSVADKKLLGAAKAMKGSLLQRQRDHWQSFMAHLVGKVVKPGMSWTENMNTEIGLVLPIRVRVIGISNSNGRSYIHLKYIYKSEPANILSKVRKTFRAMGDEGPYISRATKWASVSGGGDIVIDRFTGLWRSHKGHLSLTMRVSDKGRTGTYKDQRDYCDIWTCK